MSESPPRHIRDVQQAVDASEVYERAVFGQVLYHTGQDGIFDEMLQSLGAFFRLLAFQTLFARDHDIAAILIELDDGDFQNLTLDGVKIACRPKVSLRAREKRLGAHNVDSQTTLDALDHNRLDRPLFVVGFLDLIPSAQLLRLLMREIDVPFLSLALVAHDGDFVAGLELGLAFVIKHLRQRKHALRLGSNVDDDVGSGELEHRADEDFVLANGFFAFRRETL